MPFEIVDHERIEYVNASVEMPRHPTIVMHPRGSRIRVNVEGLPRAAGGGGTKHRRMLFEARLRAISAGASAQDRSLPATSRRLCTCCHGVLDALEIVEPRLLFGHSDGASIALIHARGSGRGVSGGLSPWAPHVFVEELSIRGIAAAETRLRNHRSARAPHPLSVDDVDGAFWGWNNIWLDPVFRAWNIEEYLPSIACGVLAIQGDEDEYGNPGTDRSDRRRVAGRPALQARTMPSLFAAP